MLRAETLEERQLLSISNLASWEAMEESFLESDTAVAPDLLVGSPVDAPPTGGDLTETPTSGPTISWIGGEGNWNDAAKWNMGRVPVDL